MKIALLGATGRTGRHVLTTALERGHGITVLVRDADRLPKAVADDVTTVVGDSTDPSALTALLADTQGVISALGPTSKEPDLHANTARELVAIMRASGPNRFVGVSGAGMNVPGDQKSRRDRIISWLINTVGGDVVKDKPAEYNIWAASGMDWTLVRPPRLMDGPATGRLEHHAHRSPSSTQITRADLATFLVDILENATYVSAAPFVANEKAQ